MSRRAALLILLLPLADAAAAYTHVVERQDGRYVRLAWPPSARPIHLAINDQIGPRLPNVVSGSDPQSALQRALAAWPAVSAIEIQTDTTPIASAGRDGTSLTTFADTAANAAQLEMAGDPIGLTLYFFEDDALTEADVLFNPHQRFTTTALSEDDLDTQDAADIEAVAVHELGHAIGLSHSGIESASMWAFTSLGQRQVDPDDVAGARALYPVEQGSRVPGSKGSSRDSSLGLNPRTLEPLVPLSDASIAGTIRVSGRPAFGAHVVSVATDGPVRSALTLPNGTYRIDALPPGSYTLYVEPLDGPHSAAFVDGCVQFGNMSGAGIYDGAELTTNFATTFYGGNDTPVELTLDAGHILSADFDLPSDTAALNPVRIGPGAADGTFTRLAEIPLDLTPGATQWVAMAGPGLDQVDKSRIRILGADISVDSSDLQRPDVSCAGEPFPTLVFLVHVAPGAALGGRTILVASGDDSAAFSGAIRIHAAPAPVPCVGDCNADHRISVDELVRGVNISLERAELDTCADFDRDGNQRVTVDELVVGVNGLLAGCV